MKTIEQLKSRAKELSKECANYAKDGVILLKEGNFDEGRKLMHKAHETSKRCRVVTGEIIRLQNLYQAS